MKKSYKPGDRYKCLRELDIWEIVEESISGLNCKGRCVEKGKNPHAAVGGIAQYTFSMTNWVYLGNFDKSSNFNNLYEKLSNQD